MPARSQEVYFVKDQVRGVIQYFIVYNNARLESFNPRKQPPPHPVIFMNSLVHNCSDAMHVECISFSPPNTSHSLAHQAGLISHDLLSGMSSVSLQSLSHSVRWYCENLLAGAELLLSWVCLCVCRGWEEGWGEGDA